MQQFKVKPSTKKSSTNITSVNSIPSISEKRLELHQNNDLINTQEIKGLTEQNIGQSMEMVTRNPPNLLRNASLRPRSGVSRNLTKTSKAKKQKSDEQMIQERIKQKLMATQTNNTISQRPLTSGLMNDNSGIRYEKKQKMMSRRGMNGGNGVKTKTMVEFGMNQQEGERHQEEENSQYVSNEEALQIMMSIIDGENEYRRLKQSNEEQFTKIRQKLLSHVSIIVLKWYKLLQDQLYNEVKTLSSQNLTQPHNSVPSSIEELIRQEIKKQFSKENGLFVSEQRCSVQQDKLARLIDNRLQRLGSLLVLANGNH